MKRTPLALALVSTLIVTACGPNAAAVQATEQAALAGTQEVMNARATSVQGTQDVADQEATAAAGTATARAESTLAQQKTRTASTAAAQLLATLFAAPMADRVAQLRSDGLVTAPGGFYAALPSFDESWAQLNWYQVSPLDVDPTDFVLRADASWESASLTANWFSSGCGLVFRYQDIDNHYVAFLDLDGYVNLLRVKSGVYAELGRKYFGPVGTAAGEASISVVAEGERLIVLVNDEKVLEREDFGLTNGWLGYTLFSGTNKGYGTHCQLENVELWVLE
jgi:hypothetical protein